MCYKCSRNACEIAGNLRRPGVRCLSAQLRHSNPAEPAYHSVAHEDEARFVFAKMAPHCHPDVLVT